jgi:hypothetical protein
VREFAADDGGELQDRIPASPKIANRAYRSLSAGDILIASKCKQVGYASSSPYLQCD